jgi:hypothetical protein
MTGTDEVWRGWWQNGYDNSSHGKLDLDLMNSLPEKYADAYWQGHKQAERDSFVPDDHPM